MNRSLLWFLDYRPKLPHLFQQLIIGLAKARILVFKMSFDRESVVCFVQGDPPPSLAWGDYSLHGNRSNNFLLSRADSSFAGP
jgi:hypothetical protein